MYKIVDLAKISWDRTLRYSSDFLVGRACVCHVILEDMTIRLSRMTMKDPDLNPDATPRLSKRMGLGTEHDSIDGSLDS